MFSRDKFVLWFILTIICMHVVINSIFIVNQSERAVLIRLGKVASDHLNQPRLYQPGLHLKVPFLDKPYRMDARNQIWTIDSDRIQTVEQVYLMVDFYFKWKIDNFVEFFKVNSAGGARSWAQSKKNVEYLIKQKVKNAVLKEFGKRPLSSLISEDRQDVMLTFAPAIKESLQSLGVTLVDFRLKQIDLPDDVSEKVYNRMRTEREKSATMHRARGREKSEKIKAEADAQVQVILAQAQKDAATIKGKADADASRIYADSYKKNPEFYNFFRTLEVYKNTLSEKRDYLVLSTDNKLFEHFESEAP